MKTLSIAGAVLGLALSTFALAPAAQAITNPADNPHPITVKGDDGQKYTDGEDTLPGYDDEACTYIPGAYFDFDNNRVRYADGQSIPWTEWERATGYAEWKANKDKNNNPSTPKPSKSPSSNGGSGSSSNGGSNGSGSSNDNGGGSGTKGSGSNGGPKSSGSTTQTGDDAVTSTDDPSATPTAGAAAGSPTTGATPTDGSTDVATTEGTEVDEVALAADGARSDSSDSGSSSAGLLILGGLAGAGLLTFAGYSVLGRKRAAAASGETPAP